MKRSLNEVEDKTDIPHRCSKTRIINCNRIINSLIFLWLNFYSNKLSIFRWVKSQALVARTTPFFLTFCLHIYFQYNFFISLLFHLFFLILTCSCQYSYNLMLRSNCICRSYQILIIHKACNSAGLKIVPLLASSTFIAPYFHYVIQTRTCIHS